MIDALQNYLAAALVIVGALFALTAAIGLLRLPDFYTRVHAASKAGTLGSCVMLIALAVYADDLAVTTRALGGVVFFLLTAPVSAHLLAKAAHASGLKLWDMSVLDDYAEETVNGSAEQRPRPSGRPG